MRNMSDEFQAIEKKIKGYGYDSLCLRYNIARDALARLQVQNGEYNFETALKLARKDKLKFYQILNDLIGEHD